MGWLNRRIIDLGERLTGENMDWLRDIEAATPRGFRRFLRFRDLANHRHHASREAIAVARLAATRFEDCGPCLQTTVNIALQNKVAPDLIRTALDRPADLPAPLDLVYRFGRAVAANDPDLPDLVTATEQALGRKALVDLVLAAAAVRVFPTIKRGLGHAMSCSLVEVRVP